MGPTAEPRESLKTLTAACEEYEAIYHSNQNSIRTFTNSLLKEMLAYFDGSSGEIEPDTDATISQYTENIILKEDGFWSFDQPVRLRLQGQTIQETVQFSFLVARIDEQRFVVKLKNHRNETHLSLGDTENYSLFYKIISRVIRSHYRNGYQHQFRNTESPEEVDICQDVTLTPTYQNTDLSLLLSLDRVAMAKLLKRISQNMLVLALAAVPESVLEHVCNNMSDRAAEMVREDIDGLGQVPISEIKRNQEQIIQLVFKVVDENR